VVIAPLVVGIEARHIDFDHNEPGPKGSEIKLTLDDFPAMKYTVGGCDGVLADERYASSVRLVRVCRAQGRGDPPTRE
jgi:hypothetical protein